MKTQTLYFDYTRGTLEKLNNFFFAATKRQASKSYHCTIISCIIWPIVFSSPVHLLFKSKPTKKKKKNFEIPYMPKSLPAKEI